MYTASSYMSINITLAYCARLFRSRNLRALVLADRFLCAGRFDDLWFPTSPTLSRKDFSGSYIFLYSLWVIN